MREKIKAVLCIIGIVVGVIGGIVLACLAVIWYEEKESIIPKTNTTLEYIIHEERGIICFYLQGPHTKEGLSCLYLK